MRGISQWVVNAEDTESVTVSVPLRRRSISIRRLRLLRNPSERWAIENLAVFRQGRAGHWSGSNRRTPRYSSNCPSIRLTAGWVTFSSAAAAVKLAVARCGVKDEQRVARG